MRAKWALALHLGGVGKCGRLIWVWSVQAQGWMRICRHVRNQGIYNLKLLPTSILDIYTVFEHINMLSIGIQLQLYIVIPPVLGSKFGVLCHLCSQNDGDVYGSPCPKNLPGGRTFPTREHPMPEQ